MADEDGTTETFRARVRGRRGGGIAIDVPFDPSRRWTDRDEHHVHGRIGGCPVRGTLVSDEDGHRLELGKTWARSAGVNADDEVDVELRPEGPLLDSVADDLAAAIREYPAAARFFESLPSFYRKNHVRRVEEAKRLETRLRRIAEVVESLRAGRRDRS